MVKTTKQGYNTLVGNKNEDHRKSSGLVVFIRKFLVAATVQFFKSIRLDTSLC